MTTKNSPTWMLFASGACVEVHANSYEAPAGSKRPVDAYVVSDCDGDCEEAAARAVETVWQAVSVQGKRLTPLVFGFDLPGRKAQKKVVGASGGLAFVVSAMEKFTGCDFGPVAATGILQSTDLDAPLLNVKGIEEKLSAALELIPSGGQVFYPESNDYEVSTSLKDKFREKRIHLYAVRDVSETIDHLVEGTNSHQAKKSNLPKYLVGSACALLVVLLLSAGYIYTKNSQLEITDQPVVSPEPIPSVDGQKTNSQEEKVAEAAIIEEAVENLEEQKETQVAQTEVTPEKEGSQSEDKPETLAKSEGEEGDSATKAEATQPDPQVELSAVEQQSPEKQEVDEKSQEEVVPEPSPHIDYSNKIDSSKGFN